MHPCSLFIVAYSFTVVCTFQSPNPILLLPTSLSLWLPPVCSLYLISQFLFCYIHLFIFKIPHISDSIQYLSNVSVWLLVSDHTIVIIWVVNVFLQFFCVFMLHRLLFFLFIFFFFSFIFICWRLLLYNIVVVFAIH